MVVFKRRKAGSEGRGGAGKSVSLTESQGGSICVFEEENNTRFLLVTIVELVDSGKHIEG
jgi:hypothetical protein